MSNTPTAPADIRSSIVNAAKSAAKGAAGKAYLFNGRTLDGFDCSGFVCYVYAKVFSNFTYIDTDRIRNGGAFVVTQIPSPGDLIFFPKGKNPYEEARGNGKEFPNHVGIVLDAHSWIGSQSSTGVAAVNTINPWWSARPKVFLRHVNVPA